MKSRIIYILFGLAMISAALYLHYFPQEYRITLPEAEPSSVLILDDREIPLTIFDTPETRGEGLSRTLNLPKDTAVIFVFDIPDRYAFWMKEMNYSIDIVWLDEKFEIIHIENSVSPDTFPKTFVPSVNSLYVLEANVRFVSENDLKVGDILHIVLRK